VQEARIRRQSKWFFFQLVERGIQTIPPKSSNPAGR
jgi:hypothetical protein